MDKKEHILEVAEDLFAEHGFEGTSIRMLSKQAGVNIAMISYYFGSKEKLFESLVEHRITYMRERLMQLNSEKTSAWSKFEKMVGLYVDRIMTNHRFHRILIREISLMQRSEMNTNIIRLMLKSSVEMRRLIRNGIESGEFRDVDIALTMASLIGTISQVTQNEKYTCLLMEEDAAHCSITSEAVQGRIKNHLISMFKAHLLLPA